jgi:hypothetical protein
MVAQIKADRKFREMNLSGGLPHKPITTGLIDRMPYIKRKVRMNHLSCLFSKITTLLNFLKSFGNFFAMGFLRFTPK